MDILKNIKSLIYNFVTIKFFKARPRALAPLFFYYPLTIKQTVKILYSKYIHLSIFRGLKYSTSQQTIIVASINGTTIQLSTQQHLWQLKIVTIASSLYRQRS